MWPGRLSGAAAGAAGTTALNVITYLDIALRGRPTRCAVSGSRCTNWSTSSHGSLLVPKWSQAVAWCDPDNNALGQLKAHFALSG